MSAVRTTAGLPSEVLRGFVEAQLAMGGARASRWAERSRLARTSRVAGGRTRRELTHATRSRAQTRCGTRPGPRRWPWSRPCKPMGIGPDALLGALGTRGLVADALSYSAAGPTRSHGSSARSFPSSPSRSSIHRRTSSTPMGASASWGRGSKAVATKSRSFAPSLARASSR